MQTVRFCCQILKQILKTYFKSTKFSTFYYCNMFRHYCAIFRDILVQNLKTMHDVSNSKIRKSPQYQIYFTFIKTPLVGRVAQTV
jgi:hypothetical protein